MNRPVLKSLKPKQSGPKLENMAGPDRTQNFVFCFWLGWAGRGHDCSHAGWPEKIRPFQTSNVCMKCICIKVLCIYEAFS